jgi:hypothetical protein
VSAACRSSTGATGQRHSPVPAAGDAARPACPAHAATITVHAAGSHTRTIRKQ